METVTQTSASPTSSASHQEIDLTNFSFTPLEHTNFATQAQVGILREYGGNGSSSSLLNDEMEVEQSPEQQEPARTKVQGTEHTVKKHEESAQKESGARAEKLVVPEEEPVVNQSTDLVTEKGVELVAEKQI